MFELLDTPCIVHVCTGSDLMHHPRVAYHVFTQPEFGYGLREGRVYCDFTSGRSATSGLCLLAGLRRA